MEGVLVVVGEVDILFWMCKTGGSQTMMKVVLLGRVFSTVFRYRHNCKNSTKLIAENQLSDG